MKSILFSTLRFLRKSLCILLTTSTLSWAIDEKINTSSQPTDSPAVKVGNLVFISGQGTGSTKTPDATGVAIGEAFQKIRIIAKQMGGGLNDVVKLTVYMADLSTDYPLLNEVVPKYFNKPYPTRSTVGVISLPKDHRVEIDAIMVLKK